jgi:hypothetical protein
MQRGIMGDASIHLLMDATLRGTVECEGVSSFLSPQFRFDSLSKTLPADTPLSELVDVIFSEISTVTKAEENKRATILDRLIIIDASYHPPKNITSIVRQKGVHASGPESVTLHGLGFYPSGKLVILPAPPSDARYDEEQMRCKILSRFIEWQARNASLHEEFEYNVGGDGTSSSSSSTTTTNIVQWTGINDGSTTMMPSEIFDAVARRDVASPVITSTTSIPIRMTKKQRRRTEGERTRRLDAILQNLNKQSSLGGKKKKAVSEKVRKMLLKSRSEGNSKVRMEDRFHLELVKVCDCDASDNGDCDASSYRFYSRQTTVGKVASSLVGNIGNDKASEFLVRFPTPLVSTAVNADKNTTKQPQRYRRLPNTMTLHDAERAGWIWEFDVVLVRIYSLLNIVEGTNTNDGPSNSVLDSYTDDEEELPDGGDDDETIGGNNATIFCDKEIEEISVAGDSMKADVLCSGDSNSQAQQRLLQTRIHAMYMSLDETKDTRTKKKPVSKQVHNMLIKSRASGNARIKQEDRIYIRVVLLHDNESTADAPPSSSYKFFSKQNNLLQVITSETNYDEDKTDGGCIELIAPRRDDPSWYQALTTSLTLGDAIEMGYIENFGTVIIRALSNDSVPCIQA